jgi:Asp-tRNA(Asn)/Glu-tRNA(Gln) amidotransferase A subunit family amidase
MSADDRDAGAPAAELTRVARALLGEQRAEQLQTALAERGAQFALVDDATVVGGPSPLTSSTAGTMAPTPASLAAWRACRRRISALDGELRAFVWSPESEPAMAARDDSATPHRPLDGMAVGVKDVIDVAGMPTRSGSPLTSVDPASRDAVTVSRLRRAGAAIIGKTECTEWALNDPAPTRNPWDGARTPGGSSSGSAVAVASGMCTATLDTQTAGDVLRPAAYNGVVGFKPTLGWTSLVGVQPVASSIDTIGVTARGVEAAGAVAAVVADADVAPDFVADDRPAPVRIGVVDDAFLEAAPPSVRANVADVADRLAAAGAAVETLRAPVDLRAIHAAHRVLTFAECAAHHLGRYRAHGHRYGPRARELLDLGMVTPAHALVAAQRFRRQATAALAAVFSAVDVLVLPVTPGPAPASDTTGDSAFQIPWTLCGLPALTLPSGLIGGLPVGVQLVGPAHRDGMLLAIARWCEDVLDVRLDPGR